MKMKSLTVITLVVFAILLAVTAYAGTVTTAIDLPFAEGVSAFLTDNIGESVRGAPDRLCYSAGNIEMTLTVTNIAETIVEDIGFRTVTDKGYGECVLLFGDVVLAMKSEANTDNKQTRHRYDQALVGRNFKGENTLLGDGRKVNTVHRQRT